MRVDGQDVARAIRESRISTAVSAVATNLEVRAVLRDLRRLMGRRQGVVAEGRDITAIAPNADVRILLTADTDARLAQPGGRSCTARPTAQTLAATRDQVVRRDRDDSTVSSFLDGGGGRPTIDSSSLTLDQVVDAVLDEVADRTGVRARDVHA